MGLLDSFLGAVIANAVREQKKEKKELDEWNKLFDECLDMDIEFKDFLRSRGIINSIYCQPMYLYNEGRAAVNAERRKIEKYKKKINEFIDMGGNATNIDQCEKLDEYIEKLKFIKSVGRLEEQDDWICMDIDIMKSLLEMDVKAKQMVENALKKKAEMEQREERIKQLGSDIDTFTGVEFEIFCQTLVEKMGFTTEGTKASGDGGIDILAYNKKPLLSGKYIIQCKRYKGSVGEPIIRDLYGVVSSERANKGILMTTGYFTKQAIAFAENKQIELIDGEELKRLMDTYMNCMENNSVYSNKSISNSNNTNNDINQRICNGDELIENDMQWVEDFSFDFCGQESECVEIEDSFLPLGCEELFLKAKTLLLENEEDVKNIGHMISVLQDYIFDSNLWKLKDSYSMEEIYENKRKASIYVIQVAQGLKNNEMLYLMYLSVLAQNYLVLGYWKNALYYYEKMLKQPGVMDVSYDPSHYAGELEQAIKIIHNMCIILVCNDEVEKAKEIMNKYNYILELEKIRTNRLISNNPHLREGFEKEWNKLSDIYDKQYIYFDLTLNWGHSIEGDGMLYAIYLDCINNNKPYDARLDDVMQIEKISELKFEVYDDSFGMEEECSFIINSKMSKIAEIS